jgi:peptidyl-prolyl cis-trans isomerase A (cyclophilin A)
MRELRRAFVISATVAAGAIAQQQPPARGIVSVVIETAAGNISVDLDSAKAPITVTNFLRYVDAGSYNGGRFHRAVTMANQPNNAVKIEVIQAGPSQVPGTQRFPAIELERTSVTGITHKDGVISMARAGPNTATGDFFICINDQPSLDFGGARNPDGQGFAAFGRVTSGMDVVKKIQSSPLNNAQALTPPIAITRIRRGR